MAHVDRLIRIAVRISKENYSTTASVTLITNKCKKKVKKQPYTALTGQQMAECCVRNTLKSHIQQFEKKKLRRRELTAIDGSVNFVDDLGPISRKFEQEKLSSVLNDLKMDSGAALKIDQLVDISSWTKEIDDKSAEKSVDSVIASLFPSIIEPVTIMAVGLAYSSLNSQSAKKDPDNTEFQRLTQPPLITVKLTKQQQKSLLDSQNLELQALIEEEVKTNTIVTNDIERILKLRKTLEKFLIKTLNVAPSIPKKAIEYLRLKMPSLLGGEYYQIVTPASVFFEDIVSDPLDERNNTIDKLNIKELVKKKLADLKLLSADSTKILS